MKPFEKNLYRILIVLLVGITFYYAYQYTRCEINRVHLATEPIAVPQTGREWKTDVSTAPASAFWEGYNTPTYIEPPLPMHKTKKQRVVYYDQTSGRLYSGSLANGKLNRIYQVEAGWTLQDYDLASNGNVLVAIGKTLEGRQGRTNWVKGVLVDLTQTKPVTRTVFEEKGRWAEETWYELTAFHFSPDGRYILHRYDGYGSERITVYGTDSLQPIPIEFPAEVEQDFGLSYAGFSDSNLLFTAMEDSFLLYRYDLTRNELDYGSYYNFLPVNTLTYNGVLYTFGRTMGDKEAYYLTQIPYLPRKGCFTALGEKGVKLRSYLPAMIKNGKLGRTSQGTQVITVSTAHELVKAIGSNRTIIMNPGTYNLSTLTTDKSKYITVDDDEGLILHDVENLTLMAATPLYAELVVISSFVNVLNLRDCKRVTIQGILAGHQPQFTDVQGAVFDLDRCTQMQIRDSVIFTSGMYGIRVTQTEQLRMENTVITESTLHAAEVIESDQVTFDTVKFLENGGGIAIKYSADITLIDCEIARNQCNGLLELVESEQVLLQASRITGNRGGYLLDPKANVEIKECLIEGNAFTVPHTEPVKQRKVE